MFRLGGKQWPDIEMTWMMIEIITRAKNVTDVNQEPTTNHVLGALSITTENDGPTPAAAALANAPNMKTTNPAIVRIAITGIIKPGTTEAIVIVTKATAARSTISAAISAQ